MAFLSILRVPGEPDELLRHKDENMDPVILRVAPKNGLQFHLCARSDDGLVIVNVWESEEGSDATFNDPDVQEVMKTGPADPSQVSREHYRVEQLVQPGDGATGAAAG